MSNDIKTKKTSLIFSTLLLAAIFVAAAVAPSIENLAFSLSYSSGYGGGDRSLPSDSPGPVCYCGIVIDTNP